MGARAPRAPGLADHRQRQPEPRALRKVRPPRGARRDRRLRRTPRRVARRPQGRSAPARRHRALRFAVSTRRSSETPDRSFARPPSGGRQNRRPAAPGVRAHEARRAGKPRSVSRPGRPEDRRVVRRAQGRGSELRRRSRGVPQHQHAGRAAAANEHRANGQLPRRLRSRRAARSTRRAKRSAAAFHPSPKPRRSPIRDALGRVLAEDIVPQINVPAHDNSAMDGYAVRFSDLEKPLH